MLDTRNTTSKLVDFPHVAPWAFLRCCLKNFFIVLPEVLRLFLGFSVKVF